MGTPAVFNIGVGGIPVHRLEDREKIGMCCYWPELGGALDLGHGACVFCIVMEGFILFLFFFLFFMIYLLFFILVMCIVGAAP